MVYFISQGSDFVKIGHGGEPEHRLSQLQVGNPNDLKLWVCFPGGQEEERIHKFLNNFRVRGEWFRLTEEVSDFVYYWVLSKNLAWAFKRSLEDDEKRPAEVIKFPATSA